MQRSLENYFTMQMSTGFGSNGFENGGTRTQLRFWYEESNVRTNRKGNFQIDNYHRHTTPPHKTSASPEEIEQRTLKENQKPNGYMREETNTLYRLKVGQHEKRRAYARN